MATKTSGETKSGSSKSKSSNSQVERKVIYPKCDEVRHVGKDALTYDEVLSDLGWKVESYDGEFEDDWFVLNRQGKKCRATNNVNKDYTNRPFIPSHAENLMHVHLAGEWRYNGEPTIIGNYGSVLDGQHSSVGFIWAVEEWRKDKEENGGKLYGDVWSEEPKMDRLMVYGVEETPDIIRTIGINRSRSMSDVIYQSPHFANCKSRQERAICSKIASHAISLLWDRTGAGVSADAEMSTRKTKGAELDFIERHPSLLKAIRFIYSLYRLNWKTNSRILGPGYASACLYLMAASDSDVNSYRRNNPPREGTGKNKVISSSKWDLAEEFWTELINRHGAMKNVIEVIATTGDTNFGANRSEKLAVFALAWKLFTSGSNNRKNMPIKSMRLPTELTADGRTAYVKPLPTFGGIDAVRKVRTTKVPPMVATLTPETSDQEELEDEKGDGKKDKPKRSGKKTVEEKEADKAAKLRQRAAEKLAVKEQKEKEKQAAKKAKKRKGTTPTYIEPPVLEDFDSGDESITEEDRFDDDDMESMYDEFGYRKEGFGEGSGKYLESAIDEDETYE